MQTAVTFRILNLHFIKIDQIHQMQHTSKEKQCESVTGS